MNGNGAVTLEVTALGDDTVLARIIRLVDQAQTGRARLQSLADRISAVFVPVVVGLALLTFLGWMLWGAGFEAALVASVSVLVIACPCALGLATPTALVAGTGAAAKSGILIRDIDALERAHRIEYVLFDKTGTLTEGKPSLVNMDLFSGHERDALLAKVAAVQAGSEHPLAKACVDAGKIISGLLPKASDVIAHVGEGVEGLVDGARLLVGTPAFLDKRGVDLSAVEARLVEVRDAGVTVSAVAVDGTVAALLHFVDAVRLEAKEAISDLQARGLICALISGDHVKTVGRVQAELGLDDAKGEVSPQGKLAYLEDLQKQGHHVAMVGDGLNDAPALARADLGLAMGSGTDVAIGAAAITLMRSDPRLVSGALDIAQRTRSKIWQNLFWAFFYNVIGIPLAAFGMLNPALAGAAMAFSSVSVVSNALLLRRWRARM